MDIQNQILEDLAFGLKSPSKEDESDLRTLLSRAAKYLHQSNIDGMFATMQTIQGILLSIKHEDLSPELLDFATSDDIWNYLSVLKQKQDFDGEDLYFLAKILPNELKFLSSLPNLFR